jgi:hypothetical protein
VGSGALGESWAQLLVALIDAINRSSVTIFAFGNFPRYPTLTFAFWPASA